MKRQRKLKRRPGKKARKSYRGRKTRQIGGFLNNMTSPMQVETLIKNAGNKINNIAKERINQIITQGEKEVDRVLPKILRSAIEDVYQTRFRMLGNFGKQQLNKLKRNILN